MTYVLVHSNCNLKPVHSVVMKITKVNTEAVDRNQGYLLLICGGFCRNTRRENQIQTKLDQPSRKNGQHQTSETRPQLQT